MHMLFTLVVLATMVFILLSALAELPRALLVRVLLYAAGLLGISPLGADAVLAAVFVLPVLLAQRDAADKWWHRITAAVRASLAALAGLWPGAAVIVSAATLPTRRVATHLQTGDTPLAGEWIPRPRRRGIEQRFVLLK